MQGPKENILTSIDKILAFKNKFQVWKKHLSSGNIGMFLLLLQVQSQTDYKEVIPLIISHLASLTENLANTFLLCYQKCVTGLGTVLLGSHQIKKIYSV
jgi:hypothetical protein